MRDEAADAIETLLNGIEAYRQEAVRAKMELDSTKKALKSAHREWVSVDDDMPKLYPCTKAGTEYSEAVAVLTSDRKIITAVWDGIDWIGDFRLWDAEGEAVTHWIDLLPLPEQRECVTQI